MPKKKKILKDLTEDEIEYYFTFLNEEITEYDCGELCKGNNKGIPYCCTAEHAVPLLYKSEFSFLKKQGDLWHKWVPKTKADKKIEETAGDDQVFCECKGVQHCVRNQRSVSCRTFPLEPYLDRRGAFIGLTFLDDFTEKDPDTKKIKCPLTKKPGDIRQQFIDSHYTFWEKLLLRSEDERETYLDSSKDLRKNKKKKGKNFTVLFPSHLKDLKSVKEYIY
ncbi:MAG: hypothetical protein OEZ34_12655 [Spirochaetia bacterium]|nr:hypothetical protein [Spirochaetia bacterium]